MSPISDSPVNDVDLDRLADYAAGLLDVRERREIDELIRTDPDWRQAHQALAGAQPRLDAALAGLRDAPLPVDVAGRLDAALAGEAGPADAGTAKVIDISRRRRWTRLAAGTTAAAAAVAAIFGTVIALSARSGNMASNSSGGRPPAAAPVPALSQHENALGTGPPAVLHSGTNYTPQNLSAAAGTGGKAAASNPAPGAANNPPLQVPDTAGGAGLTRLDDPQALRDCLAAIVTLHGGTPSVVDYARFQGRPALVVVLTGTGGRRIVVAGPECGVAGVAEIYTTTQ